MTCEEHSRVRLIVAALGAGLMAVSVYLPWYGVSLRSSGRAIGSVSAHQELSIVSVVLVVLAALALLDALVPLALAGSRGRAQRQRVSLDPAGARLPDGAGASHLLLGVVSTALIVYRMIAPPSFGGQFAALSLREGAWLALLGSLALLGAGLWSLLTRSDDQAPLAMLETIA